ncbi:MAG: hypothetical protein ACQZ3M_01700 [cyanobacterium endosymbiont of Rhopalodia fuxianensis]
MKIYPTFTLKIEDYDGYITMDKQGDAAGTIGIFRNNYQASHLEKAYITILELN